MQVGLTDQPTDRGRFQKYCMYIVSNKLASLEATLVETLPSDSLTGVKCRATSVAKNERRRKKVFQLCCFG